ncbi:MULTISPECIES: ABC transporter permease [Streptosporangium]|uniref:ABC-type nitrate/sulfonate/bicarbonate transport system permease component n=1 Tax=Streptosporangium brasiliense TaxID=47480 RepID=A0ABT9QW60_9ACTN|nr:ABC transporter permease [Streptosporangium brasiliense]MDP9860916.1 ABC-type nitrate/sulfonate/bicarbonate transport system permease component [Streptosporangium brasiliense]
MGRALRAVGRLWAVPVVLVVWELATRAAENLSFPPPTEIAASMYRMWLSGPAERLWLTDAALENIPASIGRLLAGWLLAGVVGTALGLAMGRLPVLFRFVDPLVQFARAIPPPMLLPFFMALFAIGPQMQINVIVFGIIWPVLINAGEGARHVDRQHLDTARVFGLSRGQRLFQIILPSAMPKIFAGLRVSLSLALILMVISELVGSTDGIGFQLLDAQRSYDLPGVWGTIVVLGVLGYVLNSAFLAAERRVLSWHRAAKQTT